MFSETDDLVIAKRNIARYAFGDRSDLPRNFQWTELVTLLIGTAAGGPQTLSDYLCWGQSVPRRVFIHLNLISLQSDPEILGRTRSRYGRCTRPFHD